MADLLTVTTEPDDKPRMPMMLWLATEGGRKCPQCGRYAKPGDLGDLSYRFPTEGGGSGRVSMYGHKPGKGCNRG